MSLPDKTATYDSKGAPRITVARVGGEYDATIEVDELKGRGVTFEHYDLPDTTWEDDVASMDGMGKAAWFTDTEGNILCIDDLAL